MRKVLLPSAILVFGLVVFGIAQVTNPGTVFRQGAVPVIGNCVKWVGPNAIADSGSPCGTGGNACASSGFTLDFSDSAGCDLVWAGH